MKIQKLKYLNPKQEKKVRDLIKECQDYEPITLMPSLTNQDNYDPSMPCFYLLYDNQELLSFLSLFLPSESYGEAMGFTHPMARGRGFFTRLWEAALDDLIDVIEDMELLFVTDGKSPDAKKALKALDGEYQYSELFMEKLISDSADSLPRSIFTFKKLDSQEDAQEIFTLHENIFYEGESASRRFVQGLTDSQAETFAAYLEDGTFAGIFHLTYPGEDTAYLFGFGIESSLQRQGYGRRLLSDCQACLRPGTGKITLQVNSFNEAAMALYSHSGFSEISRREYYY